MFDLSMFPAVTRVTRKSSVSSVTRVTRKPASELQQGKPIENNGVTRVTRNGVNIVTRQPASELQAESLKNNELSKTHLNPVTRVTQNNGLQSSAEQVQVIDSKGVTRVTRKNSFGLQEKHLENNDVTHVTRVTRKNNNTGNDIDTEGEHEAFEERAAIMEYDGGLSRLEAEAQARVICLAEFRQRKQRQ